MKSNDNILGLLRCMSFVWIALLSIGPLAQAESARNMHEMTVAELEILMVQDHVTRGELNPGQIAVFQSEKGPRLNRAPYTYERILGDQIAAHLNENSLRISIFYELYSWLPKARGYSKVIENDTERARFVYRAMVAAATDSENDVMGLLQKRIDSALSEKQSAGRL